MIDEQHKIVTKAIAGAGAKKLKTPVSESSLDSSALSKGTKASLWDGIVKQHKRTNDVN